jgi:hypothetical protein
MLKTCSLTIGPPGMGKGVDSSVLGTACIVRSLKLQNNWKKMGFLERPPIRQIAFNYHINKSIVEKSGKLGPDDYAYQMDIESGNWEKYIPESRFVIWHDPLKMIYTDYPQCTKYRLFFDLFWDEISYDAPNNTMREQKIHPEILKLFSQHRHRGVHIFANTQDYKMVDINFRRMLSVGGVSTVSKIIGSNDPDPTLPPVKYIWGLILKWGVDKRSIENDDVKLVHDWIPSFYWITRQKCSFYDTMADVGKKVEFDLKHIERKCAVCGEMRIIHT